MREKEGSQSWGMTEETIRDKQECKKEKRKKRLFERGSWAPERRQKWSIWKVRAYFQQRAHVSFSVGWSRHTRCTAWTRRHWKALNTSPAAFYHLCERRLEYTVAKYHQFLLSSARQSYARTFTVSLKYMNDLGLCSYCMQSWSWKHFYSLEVSAHQLLTVLCVRPRIKRQVHSQHSHKHTHTHPQTQRWQLPAFNDPPGLFIKQRSDFLRLNFFNCIAKFLPVGSIENVQTVLISLLEKGTAISRSNP